uniref:Uncharacterized protein n=1 Tax=Opuntia streptacantha TaxID=393608 RepID=A0A7C9E889_OPUST
MSNSISSPPLLNPNNLFGQPQSNGCLFQIRPLLHTHSLLPFQPHNPLYFLRIQPCRKGENRPLPQHGGRNLLRNGGFRGLGIGEQDVSKSSAKSVPFVEGSEDLQRRYLSQLNAPLSHGFQALLEVGCKERERRHGRWAGRPRRPRKGLAIRRVVSFYWLSEIDVARQVGSLVPILQQTFEDESGFADATRTVKNKGLVDAVVLGMVVEHCL